ncbi:hypothetical protein K438DRAFT_1751416 [Mycena galopus ATCC 62051]|nr:hypothetical protein K438DRAFT_1751416 [Mycena galopus ATCC 62051]
MSEIQGAQPRNVSILRVKSANTLVKENRSTSAGHRRQTSAYHPVISKRHTTVVAGREGATVQYRREVRSQKSPARDLFRFGMHHAKRMNVDDRVRMLNGTMPTSWRAAQSNKKKGKLKMGMGRKSPKSDGHVWVFIKLLEPRKAKAVGGTVTVESVRDSPPETSPRSMNRLRVEVVKERGFVLRSRDPHVEDPTGKHALAPRRSKTLQFKGAPHSRFCQGYVPPSVTDPHEEQRCASIRWKHGGLGCDTILRIVHLFPKRRNPFTINGNFDGGSATQPKERADAS